MAVAKATKAVKDKAPTVRRNTKRILQALASSGIETQLHELVRSLPPMRFLGLDINTNSTGFAVLNEQGMYLLLLSLASRGLCRWGSISTSKIPGTDVLAIANVITEELNDLRRTVHQELEHAEVPWHVGIEDFMRMFRFGRTHNKGLFQLAQLNGIVSYTCWDQFSSKPLHTHPTAARALFNIAATKKDNVKEKVMRFVETQEPSATQVLPRNRNGRLTDAAFDMTDAYVVAAFTRVQHIQSHLQSQQTVSAEFGRTYLETRPLKAKPTVEELAMAVMDEETAQAYLHQLYGYAVEDWMKSHVRELIASPN